MEELSQLTRDLRRAEEEFSTAVMETPIPMSYGNIDQGQVRMNPAMTAFYERSEGNLEAMSWDALIDPGDNGAETSALPSLREGSRDRVELLNRYTMPDGRKIGRAHV